MTPELDPRQPPSDETRTLRALAVLFLWLRMLRVLLMHPTFGPFVLMIISMMADVRKYMVILLLVVVAWASAFYAMYEHSPLYRVTETAGWPILGASPTCVDSEPRSGSNPRLASFPSLPVAHLAFDPSRGQ